MKNILSNGEQGPQGPQGFQGPHGFQGDQGFQGNQGKDGVPGGNWSYLILNGIQGPQGNKGETGAAGPQGAKGETGAIGPQGNKGETGAAGPQGAKGETGAIGPQGAKGETGAIGPQGNKGETGAAGPQGAKGETGAAGPQGAKGETGATGPQGAKGDQGIQGPQGNPGSSAVVPSGLMVLSDCVQPPQGFTDSGLKVLVNTASGFFDPAPDMPVARHSMGVASDGTRIYVLGGTNNFTKTDNSSNVMQIFDGVSWTQGPPMPVPVYGSTAVCCQGRVYVFGGYQAAYTNTVQVYDIHSNTWLNNACDMPFAAALVAVGVIDGTIYVSNLNDPNSSNDQTKNTYSFTPATNSWKMLDILSPNVSAAGFAIYNNKLLSFGGWNSASPSLCNVQIDPIGFKYRYLPNFNNRLNSPGVACIGNKIYIAGGYSEDGCPTGVLYEYSPDTNVMTRLPQQLGKPRAWVAAAALGTRFYVIGGASTADGNDTATKTVEVLDMAKLYHTLFRKD